MPRNELRAWPFETVGSSDEYEELGTQVPSSIAVALLIQQESMMLNERVAAPTTNSDPYGLHAQQLVVMGEMYPDIAVSLLPHKLRYYFTSSTTSTVALSVAQIDVAASAEDAIARQGAARRRVERRRTLVRNRISAMYIRLTPKPVRDYSLRKIGWTSDMFIVERREQSAPAGVSPRTHERVRKAIRETGVGAIIKRWRKAVKAQHQADTGGAPAPEALSHSPRELNQIVEFFCALTDAGVAVESVRGWVTRMQVGRVGEGAYSHPRYTQVYVPEIQRIVSTFVDGANAAANTRCDALRRAINMMDLPAGMVALHRLRPSHEDPSKVIYYPDGAKLYAERPTRVSLGRYMNQFTTRPLKDAEVKRVVDEFTCWNAPTEVHFVSNTDPDGWEWAYESSPNSCMRWNRSSRYLDYELHGKNHPVRAYAHPDNDLALAYILQPGYSKESAREHECGCDDAIITARTIVNTKKKTFLRIYFSLDSERDKLRRGLEELGYTQSGDTLCLQKLAVVHSDGCGRVACPYLDGNYTHVEHDDYEDTLLVSDDGVDGQNSSGWCEVDSGPREECDHCGDMCYSDDMRYVEGDLRVCQSCLDNYYTEAIIGGTRRFPVYGYVSNDEAVDVGGIGYVWCEALDSVGVHQCVISGDYYIDDELVYIDSDHSAHYGGYVHQNYASVLPDDTWCLTDEMDDIIAEHFTEDEDEDTVPKLDDARPAIPRPGMRNRNTFRVGDKVKVVRLAREYTNGWNNTWADGMSSYIANGCIYTVEGVSALGVCFREDNIYCWSWDSLELVERPSEQQAA